MYREVVEAVEPLDVLTPRQRTLLEDALEGRTARAAAMAEVNTELGGAGNWSELRGKPLSVYRIATEEGSEKTVSSVVAPAATSLMPGVEVACEGWASTLFSVSLGDTDKEDEAVAVCGRLTCFDWGAFWNT